MQDLVLQFFFLFLQQQANLLTFIAWFSAGTRCIIHGVAITKAGKELEKILLEEMDSLKGSSREERQRVLRNIHQLRKATKGSQTVFGVIVFLVALVPYLRARCSYIFLLVGLAILINILRIWRFRFPNILKIHSSETTSKEHQKASTNLEMELIKDGRKMDSKMTIIPPTPQMGSNSRTPCPPTPDSVQPLDSHFSNESPPTTPLSPLVTLESLAESPTTPRQKFKDDYMEVPPLERLTESPPPTPGPKFKDGYMEVSLDVSMSGIDERLHGETKPIFNPF